MALHSWRDLSILGALTRDLERESGFRSSKVVRRGRNFIKKVSARTRIWVRASSGEDSQNKAREMGQAKISWLIIAFWSWICRSIESLRVACCQERWNEGFLPKLIPPWGKVCETSVSPIAIIYLSSKSQDVNFYFSSFNVRTLSSSELRFQTLFSRNW